MTAPLTPARQQYLDIKARYPDVLLWYRLGDFYEMFDEDARVAAAALRITLTSRQFGKDVRVPMCGVPYHAQARFLARLIRQGYSVAICEQVSQPGNGLVEREVVRVVTPGTVSEPELLRPGENNYLAALTRRSGQYALAFVDVSTGEFCVTQTEESQSLLSEVERLQPAECLLDPGADLPGLPGRPVSLCDASLWHVDACADRLRRHLGSSALHVAGCEGQPAAQAAAGAILAYLERTNRALIPILHTLRPYTVDDAVAIDPTTRALLLGRQAGGDRDGTSVHHLLDRTCTAMGARLLARWLRRPSRRLDLLNERLDAVAELVEDPLREVLRTCLRPVGDLERITARAGQDRASAEELLALCATLEAVPLVLEALGPVHAALLRDAREEIDPAADVASGIRAAVAEPGASQHIRPGFDPDIDAAAATAATARQQIAQLESTLRDSSGIRSLKVGYNQVVGFYIEVTKPNLERVPSGFVRKQTMAHAERFVTAELLHWEAQLNDAECRLHELDQVRYLAVLRAVTVESPRLLATARALAVVDVLAALAEAAHSLRLVRPALRTETGLTIRGARHPLVEQAVGPGAFIPNDCVLGGDKPALAIVTGPNMGGKSTYLRQVALVVYLAQVGCFVPAEEAYVGLADRIFARVGAHDDLAAGQSTFLVEMAETAAIVRLATPRSLVLLDEIGRGTTSADGLAIAHAVAEYLHDVVGARTLFATHYYELARAADRWPRARNVHVRAEEHAGGVVFLYRVAEGIADRSFALHVAAMAGMPEVITARAADLLAAQRGAPDTGLDAHDAPAVRATRPALHLAREQDAGAGELEERLLAIDLASTTPLEALNHLFALQQRARSRDTSAQARAGEAHPCRGR